MSIVKDYEEQKRMLTSIRDKLQNDLLEIKEMDQFDASHGAMEENSNIIYERLPIAFLQSTYHTRREEVVKNLSVTYEPNILESTCERMESIGKRSSTEYFVLYCKKTEKTPDGYVLHMQDPFREITTNPVPVENIDLLPGQHYLEKHLYRVKAEFKRDTLTSDKLYVYSIKALPYSMTGVFNELEPDEARAIRTEDYDELDYMAALKGSPLCMKAAKDFAEKKEREGAYKIGRQELYERLGFIYVREQFKEYVLITKNGYMEAIVREKPALRAEEIERMNDITSDDSLLLSKEIERMILAY